MFPVPMRFLCSEHYYSCLLRLFPVPVFWFMFPVPMRFLCSEHYYSCLLRLFPIPVLWVMVPVLARLLCYEQKRKLFHTSVYESELQLKKLYIQTCKRLPAYGCKVYQVKELLRGKTKKKVYQVKYLLRGKTKKKVYQVKYLLRGKTKKKVRHYFSKQVMICQVYQVKYLLRGKTKKKATRLLGLGAEKIVLLDNKTKILAKSQNTADLLQWRTCGGRSHDRLQLEFRATRWSLVVPTVASMREVGLALWEILQELDTNFLEEHALLRRGGQQELVKRSLLPLQVAHTEELEALQKLLHFPEEVALRLADAEYHLFYQVPPIDYLRQVTLDLGGGGDVIGGGLAEPHHTHSADGASASSTVKPSVRSLIKRFKEVSSWVTHLIITQPTHEDRKAVLSCILRVALSCWNIGNFNGAMEIVAGLK
uniref:(California timema) hypothetical protein n=1 Tax=Timema californicum TaxID=61474 RepID=A0A7R9J5I1_TIMCA|nr:unnamed protein product [Timema californicum]